MLKKTERLARSEFSIYTKGGIRRQSDYAAVVFHPSPTFHGAVVVGKKVSKLAVTRNVIRRRVYALLYQQKTKGIKGVFLVHIKPPYNTLTKHAAQMEMRALIERVLKTA